MATAMAQVLGTYELLHDILASVPPRKVFIMQRVCNEWQTVINDSPTIQKALFRRPQTERILSPRPIESGHKYTNVEYDRELEFNQIFPAVIIHEDRRLSTESMIGYCFYLNRRVRYTPATFHNLFWTNPPVTTAFMVVKSFTGDDEDEVSTTVHCSVQDSKGITLGLLYKLGHQMVHGNGSVDGVRRVRVCICCSMPVSIETKEMLDIQYEQMKQKDAKRKVRKEQDRKEKAELEAAAKASVEDINVSEHTDGPARKRVKRT